MAEYNRLTQEWLARAPVLAADPIAGEVALTVNELLLAFWARHAENHDRHPDGSATGELANFRVDFLTDGGRRVEGYPARSYSTGDLDPSDEWRRIRL